MPNLSVLPPSRFFPAPSVAFDTEVAVVCASNVVHADAVLRSLVFVAPDDHPEAPRFAILRDGAETSTEGAASGPATAAQRILDRFRASPTIATPFSAQRVVMVESLALADAIGASLVAAGLARNDLSFYGAGAEQLASGPRLELESLVGDEAWRTWAAVERVILQEAIAPSVLTDALLDRSVQFKRKQQRDSPSIRRFVARDRGEPIAMIGYAAFAHCDLGFARPGVLVRLRDVAVLPEGRRRGVGAALLRAVAAQALEECGATQVLICGRATGIPAALYRKVSARAIGQCVMFSGELR